MVTSSGWAFEYLILWTFLCNNILSYPRKCLIVCIFITAIAVQAWLNLWIVSMWIYQGHTCFNSCLTNCLIRSLLFNRYAGSRLLHSMYSMPSGFDNVEGKHYCFTVCISCPFCVNCLKGLSVCANYSAITWYTDLGVVVLKHLLCAFQ